MPPKRKVPTTVKEANLAPRAIKVAKKKHATTVEKYDVAKCKKWFEKYADSDNKELIGPDGCQQFFTEIGIPLESIKPMIVGYKMNSDRMGYITWNQWLNFMKPLLIQQSNRKEFKDIIDQAENKVLSSPDEFKKLYMYTFNFAKSTGQKSMDVETACVLWNMMLGTQYPILQSFIQFIEEKKPAKVVNKDQWSSMLDFCKTVPENLQNYDSSASWPVLFDEYVEWRESM